MGDVGTTEVDESDRTNCVNLLAAVRIRGLSEANGCCQNFFTLSA